MYMCACDISSTHLQTSQTHLLHYAQKYIIM